MTKGITKLFLIDDHPIVREGLRAFLELSDDLEVVAEASNIDEAKTLLVSNKVDLFLLDIQLGEDISEQNGLKLIPDIKEKHPDAKIIILSSFVEEDFVRQAMRLGVQGFLSKHAGPTALRDAIYAALRGELPLDDRAVKILAEQQIDLLDSVSKREREVMALVANGLTNKAIAKELNITEKTVKAHLTNIFSKLGVKDRLQLALYAKERHL